MSNSKVAKTKNSKISDESWREKAEKELGETKELSEERIQQLRNLLEQSITTPRGRQDDAFLLRYLRAKKFDVEKAFKMVDQIKLLSSNE